MDSLTAADPRTVGEFRLLARLGAGGMGQVFLASSLAGRIVAAKVVFWPHEVAEAIQEHQAALTAQIEALQVAPAGPPEEAWPGNNRGNRRSARGGRHPVCAGRVRHPLRLSDRDRQRDLAPAAALQRRSARDRPGDRRRQRLRGNRVRDAVRHQRRDRQARMDACRDRHRSRRDRRRSRRSGCRRGSWLGRGFRRLDSAD